MKLKKFLCAEPSGMMKTRRHLIWLCILMLVGVSTATWIWPRSMNAVAGVPCESVSNWTIDCTVEDNSTYTPDSSKNTEDTLADLYTFRFSKPVPCTRLTYVGARYDVIFVSADYRVAQLCFLSDGTVWNGRYSYSLIGGKKELERLNTWLSTALYSAKEPI